MERLTLIEDTIESVLPVTFSGSVWPFKGEMNHCFLNSKKGDQTTYQIPINESDYKITILLLKQWSLKYSQEPKKFFHTGIIPALNQLNNFHKLMSGNIKQAVKYNI